MRILGIDTSCDDTSVAIVEDGRRILSNKIGSQTRLHARYGGVVPEVACRAHQELLLPLLEEALDEAGLNRHQLDAVAVTNRPGLIGALLVGVSAAKALAAALDLPLVAVHHLQAHVYANLMVSDTLKPPFVSLIVSGGHTVLYHWRAWNDHDILGQTRDDAAGEAFDKVAKLLDLGWPGGPVIDRLARKGDPTAVRFPRSLLKPGSLDFSFSGLKTAVLYFLQGQDANGQAAPSVPVEDVAASFQEAVVDVLVQKIRWAVEATGVSQVAVGGGVAANSRLRERLAQLEEEGLEVVTPPLSLCTDNAAMIAGLGYHHLLAGERAPADLDAYPR